MTPQPAALRSAGSTPSKPRLRLGLVALGGILLAAGISLASMPAEREVSTQVGHSVTFRQTDAQGRYTWAVVPEALGVPEGVPFVIVFESQTTVVEAGARGGHAVMDTAIRVDGRWATGLNFTTVTSPPDGDSFRHHMESEPIEGRQVVVELATGADEFRDTWLVKYDPLRMTFRYSERSFLLPALAGGLGVACILAAIALRGRRPDAVTGPS